MEKLKVAAVALLAAMTETGTAEEGGEEDEELARIRPLMAMISATLRLGRTIGTVTVSVCKVCICVVPISSILTRKVEEDHKLSENIEKS